MPAPLVAELDTPVDGVECRVYERQNCAVPTACRPASALGDPEAKWEATIRDISQAGARLVLRRRFEPNTALAIELPGRDESYTVLAKVVHVSRLESGDWALGCRFVSELSESEQEHLLNWGPPREAAPAPVQNVRLRLLGPLGALIDCKIRQFLPAESWPLTPGKLLDLAGTANGKRWNLTVRVAECMATKGGWSLTCRLLKAPRAAQLLAALSQ